MNRIQTNIIAIDMIDAPQYIPVILSERDASSSRDDTDEDNNILPLPLPIPVPPPESLVQSFCTTLKGMNRGRDLLFPIKKICNLNVEVTISKEKRTHYTFTIKPTQFTLAGDTFYYAVFQRIDSEVFDEEVFLKYIVEYTLSSLKKMKIDKLSGLFTTTIISPKIKKIEEMWTEFCQEFKNEEHVELSINECCVCFTMTKTTTNCGHAVCVDCISKLDDTSENHKNCPMCRQRIYLLN